MQDWAVVEGKFGLVFCDRPATSDKNLCPNARTHWQAFSKPSRCAMSDSVGWQEERALARESEGPLSVERT
jgi:hypothetical protein